MDHGVDSADGLAHERLVGEVRLEELDPAAAPRRGPDRGPPLRLRARSSGGGSLAAVEGADRIASGGEGRAEVPADEARRAGDEDEAEPPS